MKKSHRYYSQIQGQLAISGCNKAYFVVWTTVGEPFVEIIQYDKKYWQTVFTNIQLFFKTFMVPVLLGIKPLVYCPKCEKVCSEPDEITNPEDNSV